MRPVLLILLQGTPEAAGVAEEEARKCNSRLVYRRGAKFPRRRIAHESRALCMTRKDVRLIASVLGHYRPRGGSRRPRGGRGG